MSWLPEDAELRELLAAECEKHVSSLRAMSDADPGLRRVLHAAKGSAAVAGEAALSEAMARLERSLGVGMLDVRSQAMSLLDAACANLRAGARALEDTWPTPPADLQPRALRNLETIPYAAAMRDRIGQVDEALSSDDDATTILGAVFRHVHAMKGAAATVGDEPLEWFCHGLEDRLQQAQANVEAARPALDELARLRPVLSELLDDPARALQVLRASTVRAMLDDAPETANVEPDPWLRVPISTVDRVQERLRQLSLAGRELARQGDAWREFARTTRTLRASVTQAMRLIGPPRPWGPPAAALVQLEQVATQLAGSSTRLEQLANSLRHRSRTILDQSAVSQAELGTVRTATASLIFDSVRASVMSLAQRHDHDIEVTVHGGSQPVDRRLAEALVDPVLQLARNAIAHGVEPAAVRQARGKPVRGRLELLAERRSARLVVVVQDDGGGVDVEALRQTASNAGVISSVASRGGDDDALMHLLFMPGLSTRPSPDMLAGRGVGLELALNAVRRLGGTIRLNNRPGRGLTAIIEVPIVDRGLTHVLWVRSGERVLALPARHVHHVRLLGDVHPAPRALAGWMDPHAADHHEGYAIEVGRDERPSETLTLGVSQILGLELATVRPVPPLVAAVGPYGGVVVQGDGSAALLVDVLLMVDRAVAWRRRTRSSFPPGMAGHG